MIKAVIFDIDDTLSLTEAVSFEVENEILKNMGRPPMSREIHLATWELPPSKAVPLRSPGISFDTFMAAYTKRIEAYTESGKLDRIPAANYQALDELINRGKKLLILTSRTQARVKHLLEPNHPLAARLNGLYCRDNLEFRKPNPRVFDKLLSEHNLRPEQCVYVGDSLRDAAAAKGAGLFFIASLESGLRQKHDFDDAAADEFIDAFPDVVSAVESLKSEP